MKDRAVRVLLELEQDPRNTDMLDLASLLVACGYDCIHHDDLETDVYRHRDWDSTLPFTQGCRTVPTARLVGILQTIRANLSREGYL